MRKTVHLLAALTLVTLAGLLSQCAMNVSGGSSSDIPNGIVVARNLSIEGRTRTGTQVGIYPVDYFPPCFPCSSGNDTSGVIPADPGSKPGVTGGSDDTITGSNEPSQDADSSNCSTGIHFVVATDDSGYFRIDSVPPGYYNVIVTDTSIGQAAMIDSLKVADGKRQEDSLPGLAATGAVLREAVAGDDTLFSGACIVLPGTPFSVMADQNGAFRLQGIPSGRFTLLVFSARAARELINWPDNTQAGQEVELTVTPGDTVSVP